MLVEPPAPLLPATLGKLKRVAEGDVGRRAGHSWMRPMRAVLKEDGLKRFARSDYADGARAWKRDGLSVCDASGAIAAFDYFQTAGHAARQKLGDEAVASAAARLLLRSGVNVVRENFKLHGDAR